MEKMFQVLEFFKYLLVDNEYQQNAEVLYAFVPNKSYAFLLNVEPSSLVFLKTHTTKFY